MPVVSVHMWEEVLDSTTETKLISSTTDALVEVFGEEVRPFTTVLVVGVPQRRWGRAGVPADRAQSE